MVLVGFIPKPPTRGQCWVCLLVFACMSSVLVAHVRGEEQQVEVEKEHQQRLEEDIKHENDQNQFLRVHKLSGAVDKDKVLEKDEYGHLVDSKGIIVIDAGFIHAFVAALSVIIVSELGDKTFFIAAIMAMRHSRLTVFLGSIGALAVMTVLSAMLGYATTVIPRWLTYYTSCAMFAVFGIKMIKEGLAMTDNEGQEEYDEVQADLRKKEEEVEKQGVPDVETGIIRTPKRRFLYSFFSRVLLQSFTLTFLAEWGDRSQIATIILAARDEVLGVIIGGTLGHALCTGLAVMGGRFIAQKISIRTVTLVGGLVFIIFAISAFFIDPDE